MGNTKFLPKGMLILHEDRDLIVIHKPSGLLSISAGRPETRNPNQKTAYKALTDYVRKGSIRSKNRIFIVHRLDKDTSGVMVFAKNPEAKYNLQDHWANNTKYYLAVVHGSMKEEEGVLSCYIAENKELRVYVTLDKKKGKLAEMRYKVIKASKKFSLLDIELITGRKNQIRVQLADQGNAIVGDRKYGEKTEVKHLALHAYKLVCKHPYTGKQMTFVSPPPGFLNNLLSS